MSASLKGASGMRRPVRVLLVADSQPDATLLARALERGGFALACERVDTFEAMEAALKRQSWDLILADQATPCFSLSGAIDLTKKLRLDMPFIIVSSQIGEETAIAAMRAGAHDYVMKDRLARLAPVVERELRETEARRARTKYEEELRRCHEELEMQVDQRTADLHSANLKLGNVIEERRRLEIELLEVAENERRSIGFDLHDDLGQKLTGLSMMAKGLEQRLASERHPCAGEAHRIQTLINELISHTHSLAHQFSSLDMRGDDLSSVLKGLARNVRKMFDISCGLSVKGAIPNLPEHATIQLYTIAQEAVSNAIKHGKASEVSISLAKNGDKLVLTITNDGVPFCEPATAKHRMGLRIMSYRANTIGASLEIKPADKSGTIVTCTLQVKNSSGIARPLYPEATTLSEVCADLATQPAIFQQMKEA